MIGEAGDGLAELEAGAVEGHGETVLVELSAAGEDGDEEGGAAAAADVAGEIHEAGDVVVLLAGDVGVGEGVDGDEEEGEAGGLEDAHPGDVGVAGLGIDGAQREEGGGEVANPKAMS